jgi:hypothetical protein
MPKGFDAYEFIVSRDYLQYCGDDRALGRAMFGHEGFKPRIADMRDIDPHRRRSGCCIGIERRTGRQQNAALSGNA